MRQILLDGTPLQEISPDSLYEAVSVIEQRVFVFNASLRDNITMFRSFPPAALAQAIHRAHLEQLLAERGRPLPHASVLLAYEATPALDAQTAHQVTYDILSLTGVTRIVVTHTLEQAALRRYDGILVLKNGRIAESGTFDALMAQKGYFYALYTVSQ